MESSRSAGFEKHERQRIRARSESNSADEHREQRRRRRRDRDYDHEQPAEGDLDLAHSYRRSARDEHDGDENGDRKRRRSRSPTHSYRPSHSRRHEDRESKQRSRRRSCSPSEGNDNERGVRSSREGSAQISRRSKAPLPSQASSFQKNRTGGGPDEEIVTEKQKPNFAPTGLLAAASNSVSQADGTTIVLKYHEPAEARKPAPKDQWKLFIFKGADIVDTIDLSKRSCWLVGREVAVVDLTAEHPSVSKQHAVIQFRFIEKTNEFGDRLGRVRPYIIDLDSANGTSLNKELVPSSRYLELRDKDMIQFGHSTREYVLMLSPRD